MDVKDAFWCADLTGRSEPWCFDPLELGGVASRAAILDNTVYFCTDKGRLYAMETEKPAVRWRYQFEPGTRFLGGPMLNARRVYVVTAEGKILGFDE